MEAYFHIIMMLWPVILSHATLSTQGNLKDKSAKVKIVRIKRKSFVNIYYIDFMQNMIILKLF